MKRSLLFFLLVLSSSVPAQQRLSLEEAILRGVAHSRPVGIAGARRVGADARAAEANTLLLPSVRLDAGYRRLSDVDPFRVQLPGMAAPVTISPVVLDNWTTRVGVQQPLFTGFRLSANAEAAGLLAESAREEWEGEKEEAVLATMSAYWALYQAREVQRSAGENVKRLERTVADGEQMVRVGMLTRGDQLRFQVQLSSARIIAIDAESDARLAEMNCNSMLGLPLGTPLELTSTPEGVPAGDPPDDPLTPERSLLPRRADVRASAAKVEAARAGLAAARGNWWPQIALTGSYVAGRPNARYMPTRDEWKGTWDVGVMLTLDLWNWGATARQSEQAEATLRQSEEAHALLQERAVLDVARAAALRRRAADRMALAALAVEQARESDRMMRERFGAGSATPGDLLDADVALFQAETALVGARIETALASARLAKASGVLPVPEGNSTQREN